MLLESTGVARFAAETSFHSDRAATAASRVSHALARLMEEGQPTLQHGLERWLVRRVGWHYSVPNRGTRETPDTYFFFGTVHTSSHGLMRSMRSTTACSAEQRKGDQKWLSDSRATWSRSLTAGKWSAAQQRQRSDLPPGEVLIRIQWSSLNYKDALAARGHPGVAKQFPHIPGVDIAGTVVESQDVRFRTGQPVIACAYDLGAGRWGGWSEYARVPADWVMPLPRGLTLRESMVIGTAGFTSALCVLALQHHGVEPTSGDVVVTGASGGVGSIAVMLLGQLGYRVVAVTGKPEAADRLRRWGAEDIVSRDAVDDDSAKPLLSARWGGPWIRWGERRSVRWCARQSSGAVWRRVA